MDSRSRKRSKKKKTNRRREVERVNRRGHRTYNTMSISKSQVTVYQRIKDESVSLRHPATTDVNK